MGQIICIVLIFLLLGLILNHFLPSIEGMCDNGFKWSEEGSKQTLETSEQEEYNRLKKEKDTLMAKPECQTETIDKNLALLKTFEKNDLSVIRDNYNTNLKDVKQNMQTEKNDYESTKDALYDIAYPEEKSEGFSIIEGQSSKCGSIDGSENTAMDGRIGSGIDTSGESC